VPRVISFLVLLAIALLVGAIFFQVMAQFFVPLFLACVLLVIFQPLHRWMRDRLPQRPRLAAMLTTIAIILAVVLPLVWLGWKAYVDFYVLLHRPVAEEPAVGQPQAPPLPPPQAEPKTDIAEENDRIVLDDQLDQEELSEKLKNFAKKLVDPIAHRFHVQVEDKTIARAVDWASGFAAKAIVTGLQSMIGVLVGLFILVISLYYFLADGPAMVEAVTALSPLDRRYEHELLQRFAQVSRAVVVATLLTALVQGALAGIGYVFALPKEAPIFLLIALTTVSALIPVVGAFAVWASVCLYVYLEIDPVTAIVLAVYCTLVVSMIDNIMKPLILHGQSKLHPLLALLSILGGIQAFGPVGILVGPMLVSFLQALLNMVRKELDAFGEHGGQPAKPLATSMAEAIQMATGENAAGGAVSAGQLASASGDISAKTSQPPAKSAPARSEKRKR
jgi:predicted PurR-regulated permease PerM